MMRFLRERSCGATKKWKKIVSSQEVMCGMNSHKLLSSRSLHQVDIPRMGYGDYVGDAKFTGSSRKTVDME
jgi:hypothetical protein